MKRLLPFAVCLFLVGSLTRAGCDYVRRENDAAMMVVSTRGWEAGLVGLPPGACPYQDRTSSRDAWMGGWERGQKQRTP